MQKTITLDFPPVSVNVELPDPVKVYNIQKEVWISTTGTNDATDTTVEGVGTSSDPFIVRNADSFDRVFKLRIGQGTTYKLYPGRYFTKGVWGMGAENGYAHLGTGDRLIGVGGSAVTFITLSPDAVRTTNNLPRPDLGVFFAGRYQGKDSNMQVRGLTFDGNESAFDANTYVTNGLRFIGPNVRATDVRVVALRGTYNLVAIQGGTPIQIEAFGLVAEDSQAGSGGGVFTDCHVTAAPDSYFSGIYMGYSANASIGARSLVQSCTSTGGRNNQAGFTYGSNVSFRDCSCSGFKYAFYTDTDQINDILIDGCSASFSYAGFTIISGGITQPKTRISIRDTYFALKADTIKPAGCGIGILVKDPSAAGAAMGPVSVYGCTFDCPTSVPFYAASLQTKNFLGVRFVDTTFPTHSVWNYTPETPPRIRFSICIFSNGTDVVTLPSK